MKKGQEWNLERSGRGSKWKMGGGSKVTAKEAGEGGAEGGGTVN
jgi:hypothetical protein